MHALFEAAPERYGDRNGGYTHARGVQKQPQKGGRRRAGGGKRGLWLPMVAAGPIGRSLGVLPCRANA